MIEFIPLFYVGMIGVAIGSFLNVLADRLPQDETILGRSHCDHCRRVLGFKELVPVVSFLFQKGVSTCCRKKLSWQYSIVEAITGVIFMMIYMWQYVGQGDAIGMVMWWGIASALVVITVADIKFHIIPDAMLVVIVLCAAPRVYFAGGLGAHAAAAAGLGLFMLIIFLATRGRGLGFGDVKFAAVLGWLLGPVQGILALYFSFMVGGITAALLLFAPKSLRFNNAHIKKTLKSHIAFGPFMVAGTLIMLVAGDRLSSYFIELFKGLYGF